MFLTHTVWLGSLYPIHADALGYSEESSQSTQGLPVLEPSAIPILEQQVINNLSNDYALSLLEPDVLPESVDADDSFVPRWQLERRYERKYHIVRPGDTMMRIARLYNSTLQELLRYNPGIKNPNLIYVGQKIYLEAESESRLSRLQYPLELKTPERELILKPEQPQWFTQETVNYIWPIRGGRITSLFGAPRPGGRIHRGIDIAAPVGTPIYAAADGWVQFSGWNASGYGNLVILVHTNGDQTYYAHNNRNIVQVGQWVRQGQLIAEVGSTGFSTGPHLHFEVRRQQRAVNPLVLLAYRN